MPWVNVWVAYFLAVRRATGTAENDSPSEYDEVVIIKDTKTVDAFLSFIIHVRMGMGHIGEGINVMTQSLHAEDGSLPQALTVQNIYMEFCSGSKNVAVVVRNSMVYPQTLRKKTPVARAIVAVWVPEPPIWTSVMEALDETWGLQTPKWTVKQRQEKLFRELNLSELESWPPKLADFTQSLLAEYHDIFLEPSKLGCTHTTEHVIKVTDNTLFKEWFRKIPLPLVEEVCTHLQEMLDWGANWPSQSVWCNVVVLVQKKDGGLHFYIDFYHLNAYTMKDSYPLLRMQEELESLVGASHFSCLDLKSGFWQIKMDES